MSAKAVRLWEANGLLPPAQRTDSGYRVFTDDDLDVLRFIRQAKALDLRLAEIKDIIDLQRGGATPCDRVTALLDSHIADIDRTMADLHDLRHTLAEARRTAQASAHRGEHAMVCHIIETAPRSIRE